MSHFAPPTCSFESQLGSQISASADSTSQLLVALSAKMDGSFEVHTFDIFYFDHFLITHKNPPKNIASLLRMTLNYQMAFLERGFASTCRHTAQKISMVVGSIMRTAIWGLSQAMKIGLFTICTCPRGAELFSNTSRWSNGLDSGGTYEGQPNYQKILRLHSTSLSRLVRLLTNNGSLQTKRRIRVLLRIHINEEYSKQFTSIWFDVILIHQNYLGTFKPMSHN